MVIEGEEERNVAGMEDEIEMLLAGYRACIEETFRFLLVDEQLPADSPLLTGLWRHLLQQELRLAEQLDTGDDSGVSTGSSTSSSISNFTVGDTANNPSSAFNEPNNADFLPLGLTISSPVPFSSNQELEIPSASTMSATNHATFLGHSFELKSESQV